MKQKIIIIVLTLLFGVTNFSEAMPVANSIPQAGMVNIGDTLLYRLIENDFNYILREFNESEENYLIMDPENINKRTLNNDLLKFPPAKALNIEKLVEDYSTVLKVLYSV